MSRPHKHFSLYWFNYTILCHKRNAYFCKNIHLSLTRLQPALYGQLPQPPPQPFFLFFHQRPRQNPVHTAINTTSIIQTVSLMPSPRFHNLLHKQPAYPVYRQRYAICRYQLVYNRKCCPLAAAEFPSYGCNRCHAGHIQQYEYQKSVC